MAIPPAPEAPTAIDPEEARRFRVDGMDCAGCAQTVERVVSVLDQVERAEVRFGTATLLVDGAAPDAAVEAAVRQAGYSAAPVRGRAGATERTTWRSSPRFLSTAVAMVLLVAGVGASLAGAPRVVAEPLYLLAIAVGGWPIARAAVTALRRRSLDMNVLMSLAAVGAVGIGDYAEGAWVLVLFAVGTTLEQLALERTRRSVAALAELAPDRARLVEGQDERLVAVDDVAVGARILVRPGERVPLDGEIEAGASSLDESALTGESVPVDKGAGAQVFAGAVNAFGALTVRVTAVASDSTLARVTRLVEDAQGSRAPSERFVDRFARIYTPLVFGAALLVAVVPPLLFGGDPGDWIYRALALLIVACPCALVISVPVAAVSAIGGAARRGVLIKGGQVLEDLAGVRAVAVDKTGTLTSGTPELTTVRALDGAGSDHALALAAAVERGSEHPLAATIVAAARERGLTIPAADAFAALPGLGAEAVVQARALWAGGPRLAAERGAVVPEALAEVEAAGQTPVLLGEGRQVLAVLGLADAPRPEARDAVSALRRLVDRVVMLTGDAPRVARAVAGATGVAEWRAGLLPEDKLGAVRELERATGGVAMVGDGVNDAPALAGARVGVAMGAAGSDVALESADIALMSDDLERLPEALVRARRAVRVMRHNVALSLAVKAVFVVLAPLGLVTLVAAIVADMGISLLVTLNALRLLR